MTYEKKLPPVRQILKLANMVEFPATCLEVFKTAKRQGFSKNMLDFLSLKIPINFQVRPSLLRGAKYLR